MKINKLAFGLCCIMSFVMAFGIAPLFLALLYGGWLQFNVVEFNFWRMYIITGTCLFFVSLFSLKRLWSWERKK